VGYEVIGEYGGHVVSVEVTLLVFEKYLGTPEEGI